MNFHGLLFALLLVFFTSSGYSRCLLEKGDLFDRFHFRHATKYYDPETGLYYYGERFYSPELGRWINRDPIGEHSFVLSYMKGKSKEEKARIKNAALEPSYLFVKNDPINEIDVLGLDRWVGDSLHTYIIVEEWSADGKKVIGHNLIEFGPKSIWTSLNPLCCGQVRILPTVKPNQNSNLLRWMPTSSLADQILLQTAKDLKNSPPDYNFVGFNCRHFTMCMQSVGLPGATCPIFPLPFYPPVLPPHQEQE